MKPRSPGLDQSIYPHSSFMLRPRWSLPGGERLALNIYLYLERFAAEPAEDDVFDRRFEATIANRKPFTRGNEVFEYGNRVGIFRVLDALDRLGLKASVPANSAACEAYPFLIEQFNRRGYEFLAHGSWASRMITSQMPLERQREEIESARAMVERTTGAQPSGWMSQDYGQSTQSPQLLAEAGFAYLSDYSNDDHPYRTTTAPSMIAMPNQSEWDDVQMLVHRRLPSQVWATAAKDAFDQLRLDGEQSARVFTLHIHPWISGQPARIKHLEGVLEHIAGVSKVWYGIAGDIASYADRSLP
jgi:allantoinase